MTPQFKSLLDPQIYLLHLQYFSLAFVHFVLHLLIALLPLALPAKVLIDHLIDLKFQSQLNFQPINRFLILKHLVLLARFLKQVDFEFQHLADLINLAKVCPLNLRVYPDY